MGSKKTCGQGSGGCRTDPRTGQTIMFRFIGESWERNRRGSYREQRKAQMSDYTLETSPNTRVPQPRSATATHNPQPQASVPQPTAHSPWLTISVSDFTEQQAQSCLESADLATLVRLCAACAHWVDEVVALIGECEKESRRTRPANTHTHTHKLREPHTQTREGK